MTVSLLLLCGLILLAILYRLLERRLSSAIRWLRHTDTRVTGIEIKDYGQDARMDAHDQKLETHDRRFQRMSVEVKELGRDIGWGDDRAKTDVMKKPDGSDS